MSFRIISEAVFYDLEIAATSLWSGLQSELPDEVKGVLDENVTLECDKVFKGKNKVFKQLASLKDLLGKNVEKGLHLAMVQKDGDDSEKLLIWYSRDSCWIPTNEPTEVQIWDWKEVSETSSEMKKIVFTAGKIFGDNYGGGMASFKECVSNYDEMLAARVIHVEKSGDRNAIEERRRQRLEPKKFPNLRERCVIS